MPLNIKGSSDDENVSLSTAPHTAIVEPPLTERIIVFNTSPPRVSMPATYLSSSKCLPDLSTKLSIVRTFFAPNYLIKSSYSIWFVTAVTL